MILLHFMLMLYTGAILGKDTENSNSYPSQEHHHVGEGKERGGEVWMSGWMGSPLSLLLSA